MRIQNGATVKAIFESELLFPWTDEATEIDVAIVLLCEKVSQNALSADSVLDAIDNGEV